jgi:hypothetical protein
MAVFVIAANSTSQRMSSACSTDKIRFATTTAIHYAVGNSSVTASAANAIVPANTIYDEFVGVGNWVAVIRDTADGNVSLTELGSATSGTAAVS